MSLDVFVWQSDICYKRCCFASEQQTASANHCGAGISTYSRSAGDSSTRMRAQWPGFSCLICANLRPSSRAALYPSRTCQDPEEMPTAIKKDTQMSCSCQFFPFNGPHSAKSWSSLKFWVTQTTFSQVVPSNTDRAELQNGMGRAERAVFGPDGFWMVLDPEDGWITVNAWFPWEEMFISYQYILNRTNPSSCESLIQTTSERVSPRISEL